MTDAHGNEYEPIQPGPAGASGAGQKQVRVQFNEANVDTLYANAFRTNLGNGEVFLDLGINRFLGQQPQGEDKEPVGSFRFDVSHRVAMNLQTTKQLAQHLTQVVDQIEKQQAAQKG
ncbi:MAG: DUF3467 domain-containing protein [Planctomycetota bacterium]